MLVLLPGTPHAPPVPPSAVSFIMVGGGGGGGGVDTCSPLRTPNFSVSVCVWWGGMVL